MYACLSHLFLYNDICYSMYVIKIMVVKMMISILQQWTKAASIQQTSCKYKSQKQLRWRLDKKQHNSNNSVLYMQYKETIIENMLCIKTSKVAAP